MNKKTVLAFGLGIGVAGLLAARPAWSFGEYLSGIEWAEPPLVSTEPGMPPSDAVALFDGKSMDKWEGGADWIVKDGVATSAKKTITTKDSFGDCQLHIEWAAPAEVKGDGQGRGNSGVYFMSRYEVQVLDSWHNPTYFDGQAGSIYKQHPPLVNASKKPGEWQTYDIVFHAPKFDEAGKVTKPASFTVLHNGVLVQDHYELAGQTEYNKFPFYAKHPDRAPIQLQYHGNPVQFRNIWLREITELASTKKHEPLLKPDPEPKAGKRKAAKKARHRVTAPGVSPWEDAGTEAAVDEPTRCGAALPGAGVDCAAAPGWRRRDLLLLLLVLAAAGVVRRRLTDVPLERDEGEYAYAGQLLRQGVPPYRLACSMKFPGTFAAYAAIMTVFGESPAGIHTGLIAANSLTIMLVAALGRRLFSQRRTVAADAAAGAGAGVAAAAAFALMSVDPGVLGFAAHATHFVALSAVAGVLLLLHGCDRRSAPLHVAAGLLLGLAVLMKQHGACFAMFALAYAGIRAGRSPAGLLRMAGLCAGMAAPFVITCLALTRAGAFDEFRFWTITYARQYAGQVAWDGAWRELRYNAGLALGPTLLMWVSAVVGAGLVWRQRRRCDAAAVLGLLAASIASVCPGFYFRPHYFIMLLPAAALLNAAVVGLGSAELRRLGAPAPAAKAAPVFAFTAALAGTLLVQAPYLLATPEEVLHAYCTGNPFGEAKVAAEVIRADTRTDDRIAVLGSEPEICFYSGRKSATRHIYVYPLMERQPFAERMQRQMIDEIEAARPKYVVMVLAATSWLAEEDSPRLLADWAATYCSRQCEPAGSVCTDGLSVKFVPVAELVKLPAEWREVLRLHRRRD